MKIHVLHHVHVPITHGISQFLNDSSHEVSHIHLFEKHHFPAIKNIDWLIIMGGPMSANDEAVYPYLASEKVFIKSVIDAGKTVLGICLGAQLIADVLGAQITKLQHPEFGWHTISPSPDIKGTLIADIFNKESPMFHSHGEMFDIPAGAKRIAFSQACENQGFIYQNRVIAIQFHPEITEPLATLFDKSCRDAWHKSPYYDEQFLSDETAELFHQSTITIKKLLQTIERSIV